jgi:hypothetical protein
MEILNNLPIKHELLTHSVFATLKKDIVDKVKEFIPEIEKLRLSQELTTVICNMVENLYRKSKKITGDILTEIFRLSPDEIKVVENQIQFSYDHKLIVKIPFSKRFIGLLKRLLKKFII